MRRFIAFAACLAAAACFCGCTLGSSGSPTDSGSEAAKTEEYQYIPVWYEFDESLKSEEWKEGGALTYSDFVLSKDYIEEFTSRTDIRYIDNYVFWNGYNDDGDLVGAGGAAPRLSRRSTVQDVLEMYGETELHDVDTLTDKFYNNILCDGYEEDAQVIESCTKYAQYYYKLPGLEGPFEQYVSNKFYFDEDGNILLFAICFNEDLMLNYHFGKEGGSNFDTRIDTSFDPEGKTLKPSLVMKGVFDFDRLRTDRPYPLYTFKDGKITAEWYNYDGTKSDEHPESAFDNGVSYRWENGEIILDLKGYSDEEVYFIYDRNLQSYELHEPCWRDEGTFLQLTEVRSK